MMGLPFLAALKDALSSAQTWQQAEGALFCLRAVHQVAKTKAMPAAGADAAATQLAQQTDEVMRLVCALSVWLHDSTHQKRLW